MRISDWSSDVCSSDLTVGYYRWHGKRKAAYSCSRHSNETENRGLPVTRLAIYDMDRTITISGTYTPFLLHVSAHMAPWRLVFALVIPFIMLAYVLRLIPRTKLKEINQALMIGPNVRRARLQPHIESYAAKDRKSTRLNSSH